GEKIFHGGGYHFQEALFSKKNGLFKWHPITLLDTLGLIWMAYKKRWLWWFLPAMVLQFLFIGSLTDWTGSYAFGQRRWVSGLPIWAMGLAALFSIRWKPWRWLLRLGVVYLIVWNFFVFWAWHGGFFEGGRHSTSKVFWMIRNTPHELFGGVFDLALFPGLILDFSARRVSLFLLAWLCTTGAGLLIFASLKHCPTRRVGTLIALVPLLAPIGLVAAFFHADQTSRIVLQGNYSLDSLYPNRQIGLHPQRIGGKESFTGEVDNLILSAHQRLQVRIKNPQLVDSLDCVAYLSSAAAGIRKGSECLRVCVSGVAGEASQTLWVGEELDFPHPEFGGVRRQGGKLRPVTGELAPDGTAYFSYGNRFSFAPVVVREVTIENRLGAGEIGIEALSFSPVGLSDYPIESTREFESGHQPHTLDLASIFNGVIPYASPEIGLTPGGEVDWRGVPFHISGSAKENCLWTGFEKGALRFATPLPAIECDAVHLLIGVFTDSATRTQENIATVRLYFADGKSSVDEIIMGRDVRPPSSLYTRDSMVENWTIPVVSRNSSGLWVKTLLCPRGSAPLIGIEIARNFETKSSLVVYAATAVSSNAMKM
ncbi:MAG: hypothetical protein KC978_19035, partial [Candidatus Omnitrophica bacterium]|nr:hypothetical protein [Candidatus Omnitrophota bacterium]